MGILDRLFGRKKEPIVEHVEEISTSKQPLDKPNVEKLEMKKDVEKIKDIKMVELEKSEKVRLDLQLQLAESSGVSIPYLQSKLAELANEPAPNWCRVGKAQLKLGIVNEDTLIAFLKALQMDPNYAEAWEGLGKVFEMNDRNHEAKQSFERAKQVQMMV